MAEESGSNIGEFEMLIVGEKFGTLGFDLEPCRDFALMNSLGIASEFSLITPALQYDEAITPVAMQILENKYSEKLAEATQLNGAAPLAPLPGYEYNEPVGDPLSDLVAVPVLPMFMVRRSCANKTPVHVTFNVASNIFFGYVP